MSTIRRFEDLNVWKKSRELTKFVYEVTNNPGFHNDLRLKNQMRDAAVSVLSNIAEGFSRSSDKEFIQFLYVSRASVAELQSQCYVALDQRYFSAHTFQRLYDDLDHTSRMLSKLIQYLRGHRQSHTKGD